MVPQNAWTGGCAQFLRPLERVAGAGRRAHIAGTTSLMKRSAFSSDARADMT
jgi:hypothetical protein